MHSSQLLSFKQFVFPFFNFTFLSNKFHSLPFIVQTNTPRIVTTSLSNNLLNFKYHHKIKKKSGNMKTAHAAKLPGLTTLFCKVDCWVQFHLHHLFVLAAKFFKSLWLMPLVLCTHHAGASYIVLASTGLLLHSIATPYFHSCSQAQSSEGDSEY